MKILAAVCCGLTVLAATIPAQANPFGGGFRFFVQGQGQGRGEAPPPQRGPERQVPQRDLRGAPGADRGRMSPDERRQLRRDIQDAGRDIYHPARPAPDPRRNGRR